MKVSRLATLSLAVTLIACSSTLQVNTDYAPGTDFSKYKTFTVKHGAAAQNAIAVQRFELSITNALTARGLTPVADGADLNVFDHFVLGKDTQLNSYGYGGWGGRWGGGMQTTQVQEIPTGTVVVDLVDTKTNKMVWRGIAKDELSTTATPEERQQKSDAAAQQLFANFPPAAK